MAAGWHRPGFETLSDPALLSWHDLTTATYKAA
jgi:hypothetical protein